MKNYVSNGCRVTHTASKTIVSGEVVAHGKLVGIASTDCATGDQVELVISGAFELPVKSGVTIAEGDKLYVITTESVVTNAATGNVALGFALTGGTTTVEAVLR